MGASASKASRTAAGAAARKYPIRAPETTRPSAPASSHPAPPPPPPPPPTARAAQRGPTVHPTPQAHTTRSAAVDQDASDPDFASSLRTLGPVQRRPPTTMLPPSAGGSIARERGPREPDPRENAALGILAARTALAEAAELEEEELSTISGSARGRSFLDVYTVRRALELRDGEVRRSDGEIEKALGLRAGVVAKLGGKGVVGLVDEVGRADKEIRMV